MSGAGPDAWGQPDRWRALGTYVDLRVAHPAAAGHAGALARSVLDEVDRTCSRFRSDSDLSRANRLTGQWVGVSTVLVGAVRVALEAAEETAGLVDPCLGELIVAAGYDRTFAQLRTSATPVALPAAAATDRWRDVEVRDDALRIPPGVAVDLGATGKAYAADLVAHTLAQALDVSIVVSVGETSALSRRPASRSAGRSGSPTVRPTRSRPRTGNPRTGSPRTGSPCTSRPRTSSPHTSRPHTSRPHTSRRRRGRPSMSCSPRAGWPRRPSRPDAGSGADRTGTTSWTYALPGPRRASWVTASAFGATAVAANTASLGALVLGHGATEWLEERGVAARLVDHAERVHCTRAWSTVERTAA